MGKSKSELKRLCTMKPVDMAEDLFKIRQELAAANARAEEEKARADGLQARVDERPEPIGRVSAIGEQFYFFPNLLCPELVDDPEVFLRPIPSPDVAELQASVTELEINTALYYDRNVYLVRLIAEGQARENRLREQLKRVVGWHSAPNDCYVTGPMTGNAVVDLVSCPSCEALAMLEKPADSTALDKMLAEAREDEYKQIERLVESMTDNYKRRIANGATGQMIGLYEATATEVLDSIRARSDAPSQSELCTRNPAQDAFLARPSADTYRIHSDADVQQENGEQKKFHKDILRTVRSISDLRAQQDTGNAPKENDE